MKNISIVSEPRRTRTTRLRRMFTGYYYYEHLISYVSLLRSINFLIVRVRRVGVDAERRTCIIEECVKPRASLAGR